MSSRPLLPLAPLALLTALLACSRDALTHPAPDSGGGVDLRPVAGDAGVGPFDLVVNSACAPLIDALTKELYAQIGTCTVVVRLDYQTRRVLGHQVLCGKYQGTTEPVARMTAEADTGYGGGFDVALHPSMPGDNYVFFRSPGDFGGGSAVSVRSGLSVFGGSIIWSGSGDITYPRTWRTADALGDSCPASGGIQQARGYDLENGQPLGTVDVQAALDVVRRTAVPAAMWQGGYVFDAVVLRYPRSVGVFDPSSAEWVVLVNGGWLE